MTNDELDEIETGYLTQLDFETYEQSVYRRLIAEVRRLRALYESAPTVHVTTDTPPDVQTATVGTWAAFVAKNTTGPCLIDPRLKAARRTEEGGYFFVNNRPGLYQRDVVAPDTIGPWYPDNVSPTEGA